MDGLMVPLVVDPLIREAMKTAKPGAALVDRV